MGNVDTGQAADTRRQARPRRQASGSVNRLGNDRVTDETYRGRLRVTTKHVLSAVLSAVLVWPAAMFARVDTRARKRSSFTARRRGHWRMAATTRRASWPTPVTPPTRRLPRCWPGSISCAGTTTRPSLASSRSQRPTRSAPPGSSWRFCSTISAGDSRRAPRLNTLVDRFQRSREPLDLYRGALAARALGEYRIASNLLRKPRKPLRTTPPSRPCGVTSSGIRTSGRRRPRRSTKRWRSTTSGPLPIWAWPAPWPTQTRRPRAPPPQRRSRSTPTTWTRTCSSPSAISTIVITPRPRSRSTGRSTSTTRASRPGRWSRRSRTSRTGWTTSRGRSNGCSPLTRCMAMSTAWPATAPHATTGSKRRSRLSVGAWRSTRRIPAATPSWVCTCCGLAMSLRPARRSSDRSRRTRSTPLLSTC